MASPPWHKPALRFGDKAVALARFRSGAFLGKERSLRQGGSMGQWRDLRWGAVILLVCAGCMSGPLQDNPLLLRSSKNGTQDNPVFVPLGPQSYGYVFEKTLDVLNDYFEIAYSNRYEGRIETFPRIAPGLGQPWKGGSPDFYQRLLASFQSIRHRGVVLIKPAEDGGYFIEVKVLKELEDKAQPDRAISGMAAFRSDNTVDRQFEVVDATVFDSTWIPIGRDLKLEQVILCRLANFDRIPSPPVTPPPQAP